MKRRFNKSEEHRNWSPLSLMEVNLLFHNLPIPWWIAGGIALEMFVGFPIREHADIDAGIYREDQLIIQKRLEDWDLYEAGSSNLIPWMQGKYLELGINQVWCRRRSDSPWVLEIMFMEREGDNWFFRRDPRVHRQINELIHHTTEGIPFISPEIQLLFKARAVISTKDVLDFQTVLPHLSKYQYQWLLSSLRTVFPTGHPWIDMLL